MQKMKIDNLIFRLNNLATERETVFDKLWVLEEEGKKLREELLKEMKLSDKK